MVTVIIPAYNVADYLSACLESLLCQTDSSWCCVVVDDGAVDNGSDVMADFVRRDGRIRGCLQRNGGEIKARWRGYTLAKTDFVCFLDGDDILAPTAIQAVSGVIAHESPVDIVIIDAHRFTDGLRPVVFPCQQNGYRAFSVEEFPQLPLYSMPTGIFHRGVLENASFEQYAVGADILFAQRALLWARKVCVLPQSLYGYRQRASSVSHRPTARSLVDGLRSCMELLRLYDIHPERYAVCERLGRLKMFCCVLPAQGVQLIADERKTFFKTWSDAISASDSLIKRIPLGLRDNLLIRMVRWCAVFRGLGAAYLMGTLFAKLLRVRNDLR